MKNLSATLILLFILAVCHAQDYRIGSKVQGRWGGYWHKGTIVEIKDNKYKVHYDGYGVGYDEWLTREQFRTEADKKNLQTKSTSVSRPSVDSSRSVITQENTEKAVPITVANQKPPPSNSQPSTQTRTAGPTTRVKEPVSEQKSFPAKTIDTTLSKPTWTTKNTSTTIPKSAAPPMVGDKVYLRSVLSGNTAVITTFYLDRKDLIIRNPRHGLSPIDLAAEKKYNTRNVGKYKIDGERFMVEWLDGSTTSWKVAYSPVVIYGLDGGVVNVIKPMPNGYTLSGTYTAVGINDESTSSQFDFKFDGSFRISGALYASSNAGTDKGKYTINGNTLQMFFENGKTSKSSICQATVGTKKFLVINNVSYPLN